MLGGDSEEVDKVGGGGGGAEGGDLGTGEVGAARAELRQLVLVRQLQQSVQRLLSKPAPLSHATKIGKGKEGNCGVTGDSVDVGMGVCEPGE